MKSLYIILVIILLTLVKLDTNAQTTSAPAGNNPVLMEAALKANKKAIKERNTQVQTAQTPKYIGQIDENDKYLGKEKEYLNMITSDALPSDFPVYEKGLTFVEYDLSVEVYFKSHTYILKDAYKSKYQ